MAPWKIVLQPQKVSRAAGVSGMLGIRANPSNCFCNLLQSVTFLHEIQEDTHLYVSTTSIN